MQRTAISLMLFVTIGTCAVFYTVSRQVLLERTCQADVGGLRQVYTAVENMRQTSMALGQQVYYDNQVAYLLYSSQFDPNKLCVAMSQLDNYRTTNPYVDSIYVYNKYLTSMTVCSTRFGTYDAPLQGPGAFFDTGAAALMEGERRGAAMLAPRLVNYEGEAFFRQMRGRQGEGYFVSELRGVQTLVSYMCPEDNPWQYLRFTPYDLILGEVDRSIRNLIAISIVVVVLGMAVAYLFARLVRKPVGDIYRHVERLEEGRNTRQSYRQELLRNLLYGAQSPGYVLRQGVLDKLRLGSERQSCVLALVRLRDSEGIRMDGGSDQLGLARYGAGNVAAEICGEKFRAQAIDLGGRHLALLLALPENGEYEEDLAACLKRCAGELEKLLRLKTSYTISDPFPFQDIEPASRTAWEADSYQLFYPAGNILWARQVMDKNARHYVYPSDREAQMLELVLACQEEQACSLMHGIIRETEQYALGGSE